MANRMPLTIVVVLALIAATAYGIGSRWTPATVAAAQQPAATWNSTMIWRPTLEEAGIAIAELVNQIDAACWVDVDPVDSTNGAGPEGPVYAFAITWSCPNGASEQPEASWQSSMLWYPTLADAGVALAELVNQIDATCSVDVDPVVAANGAGPEGPVYAFVVTWACGGGGGPSASAPDDLAAAVIARDIAFEPARITIPADTEVVIGLANEGESVHTFTIEELGVDVELAPGDVGTLTLDAPAGTYEFYCGIPGHRDLGMEGTLIVE